MTFTILLSSERRLKYDAMNNYFRTVNCRSFFLQNLQLQAAAKHGQLHSLEIET